VIDAAPSRATHLPSTYLSGNACRSLHPGGFAPRSDRRPDWTRAQLVAHGRRPHISAATASATMHSMRVKPTTHVRGFVRQHVASTRVVIFVAVSTLALVLCTGAVVARTDPERFDSLFDGWWWAATTITTVGYGDLVPTSVAGRVTALILMFAGIALVSLLTASIAALLLSADVQAEELHLERRLDNIEALLVASIRQDLSPLVESPDRDARGEL